MILMDAALFLQKELAQLMATYMKKTYGIPVEVDHKNAGEVLNVYNEVLQMLDEMERGGLQECGGCSSAFDINGILNQVTEQLKVKCEKVKEFANTVMHIH